jgi:hypothetical protein
MTVIYRTLVYWVPPSPLGLVGNRWAIEHRCDLCHRTVPTDQLLSHAKDHAPPAILTNRPEEGPVC